MSKVSEEQYLALLHSCADGCTARYCFFKMFLEHQHPAERLIVQLKCLEKMKWIWSKEVDKDIGWQEAGLKWVEQGFAKAFSSAYNKDYSVEENFDKTIAEQKSTSN